jgi:hypothetical protein
MSKEESILKYSNPFEVQRKIDQVFGKDNVDLHLSSRANKKYMIQNPSTRKWTHFGQWGFEDYTRHKNEMRKAAFQRRNHRWATADPFSAAFASYYFLW